MVTVGGVSEEPESHGGHQRDEHEPSVVGLGPVLGYFLRLGTIGFGGPIATVGYMQRDLVERRGWIDRRDFLDGVALGQTMPGPLAAQVAMWVGYLQRGPLGALAVAVAFVAPSFVIVVGVGALYARYSGLAVVQSLFYAIAPAVMAIITIAAVKLLRLTDRRDARLWGISAVVFTVTAATGSEPALLIVTAGLLLITLDARPRLRWPARRAEPQPEPVDAEPADLDEQPPTPPRSLPLLLPAGTLGAAAGGGVLVALGLFFAKTGALVFGSGLAIVPFLREGVVEQHHWLTSGQFLDAVAMGLITPGPVVITAGFIGYLVASLPGAVVATVAIFTPIYLAVVIPGRWFLRHRDNRQVKAFVAGATAAAAGALAGAVVVLTRQAVTDRPTAVIALVTLALLCRFKIPEPAVVVAAGGLGLLIH
jgi:chromate transporter